MYTGIHRGSVYIEAKMQSSEWSYSYNYEEYTPTQQPTLLWLLLGVVISTHIF